MPAGNSIEFRRSALRAIDRSDGDSAARHRIVDLLRGFEAGAISLHFREGDQSLEAPEPPDRLLIPPEAAVDRDNVVLLSHNGDEISRQLSAAAADGLWHSAGDDRKSVEPSRIGAGHLEGGHASHRYADEIDAASSVAAPQQRIPQLEQIDVVRMVDVCENSCAGDVWRRSSPSRSATIGSPTKRAVEARPAKKDAGGAARRRMRRSFALCVGVA